MGVILTTYYPSWDDPPSGDNFSSPFMDVLFLSIFSSLDSVLLGWRLNYVAIFWGGWIPFQEDRFCRTLLRGPLLKEKPLYFLFCVLGLVAGKNHLTVWLNCFSKRLGWSMFLGSFDVNGNHGAINPCFFNKSGIIIGHYTWRMIAIWTPCGIWRYKRNVNPSKAFAVDSCHLFLLVGLGDAKGSTSLLRCFMYP